MANARPGAAPPYVQSVAGIACSAVPDSGILDQTALVQAALDSAIPGETVVLPMCDSPTARFIKCGAIKIPSGVSLTSMGAVLFGATVSFSASLSQAYNSVLRDVWFKGCKFLVEEAEEAGTLTSAVGATATDSSKAWATDKYKNWYIKIMSGPGVGQVKKILSHSATTMTLSSAWSTAPTSSSTYILYCNISCIVFDHCTLDGTSVSADSGSTVGDAIFVGQYGFDVKLTNGTQIYNYTGWGFNCIGNPSSDLTAFPYLASGVFCTMSDTKIFNCGGNGSGGAIRMFGGPQDGSSLHLSNVLLDHCQYALYVDDASGGNPDITPTGSGGITVFGNNIRIELCGNQGAETPSIYNARGNITINGLWYSSSVTTSFYTNVWHKAGKFRVKGGRQITGGAQTYGIYCEAGKSAEWDIEQNNEYNIGASKGLRIMDTTNKGELVALRFRITKVADGLTVQCLAGNGFGWGAGGTAGDRWNSGVSDPVTNGGATVPVGNVYDRIYYQLSAGGGMLRVQLAYRVVVKVIFSKLDFQNAGLSGMYTDVQLLNGTADFTLMFRDSSGAEINIQNLMATGKYLDATVMVALQTPV